MYDNTNFNQAPNMNNGMPPQKKKGKAKYVAALLILAFGILLIVIGGALMTAYDFSDFEREDITKDFSEYYNSVNSIYVDAAFSDIKVVAGNNLKVECKNAVKDFLDIDYKNDGSLKIDTVNKKSSGWFMTFSVVPLVNSRNGNLFGEITITVPERTIDNIKIESAFGLYEIDGIDVTELEMDNVFGEIKLKNINCRRYANLENTFGELSIENCALSEIDAENTFGEIKMDKCSISGNSKFEVTFGDLKADLYGDVYDYDYDFETVMGSSKINGEKPKYYKDRWSCVYEMDAEVTFGDVQINFDDRKSPQDDSSISNDNNKSNESYSHNSDKDGNITDNNGNKIVP